MTQPKTLDKPVLLIGEGRNDVAFYTALVSHLKIDNIAIEQYGGKDFLGSYLRTTVVRSGFANLRAIGITRDIDNSSSNTFESVRGSIRSANLPIPSAHGVIVDGSPKVGVYLHPDGSSPGMLEDLCLTSISESSTIACVDKMFECIETSNLPVPKLKSKARLGAWLAITKEPKSLGVAAEKGYFPWEHQCFQSLIAFIKSLAASNF